MMKLNPAWNEYYRETEPSRRRVLLQKILAAEPDDGANALRVRLFKRRHQDPADPDHEVDRLLWQCVSFIQICASARFFKKSARRDVESSLAAIGYDEILSAGAPGEEALYWEFRNGARRYLKTCMDSSYRRVLFGLMSSGDGDRSRQMSKDVHDMTIGLADRLQYHDRLQLWIQAVNDEFRTIVPDTQG